MSQRPVADGPAWWIDVELPSVAENLALDEALLAEAHAGIGGGSVVRTWMAHRPTVVLGSSSQVALEVDLDACRLEGVDVLRRPSGGLTVVLGPGCVMWSVVAEWTGPTAIEALHAALLDPLAASLRTAGGPVVRRGSSDLAIEAADGFRKVSGNALRLRRGAVLYHGTLLDEFDLDLVPPGAPPPAPRARLPRRPRPRRLPGQPPSRPPGDLDGRAAGLRGRRRPHPLAHSRRRRAAPEPLSRSGLDEPPDVTAAADGSPGNLGRPRRT